MTSQPAQHPDAPSELQPRQRGSGAPAPREGAHQPQVQGAPRGDTSLTRVGLDPSLLSPFGSWKGPSPGQPRGPFF